MSDIHLMMSRIREAQEQLIHSGRLASLGEMAAGIGHELTQPLNAILLFARNCIKCLENPEKNRNLLEENLQVIIDRVQKAASIINSLKSFARKEVPDPSPVQLNLVLGNIMRFLDSQLTLSDIACDLHFTDQLPPVLGQEVRLEQVFLNILQNAILAMGDTDNPVLTISTYLEQNIEPETLNEKTYVVAAVRDNGEGIPADKLGRIFDPFFSARKVGHGMGLGLSIVDRIVRSYNGFIKVESKEGVGSCFFVYLPAYVVEDHSDA
jgi:C4-dicarboxylate-specific signal transduction histidine kinase